MKVKEVIKEEKPEFKPFTIEITIESEDELREIWHLANLGIEVLTQIPESINDSKFIAFPEDTYTQEVFDFLEVKTRELGLQK